MLTATEPFEVTVTDLVTEVPTETLPNERELALKLSVAAAALRFSAKFLEDEFALADNVTDCAEPTAATLAVNDTDEEPEGIVAALGTVT